MVAAEEQFRGYDWYNALPIIDECMVETEFLGTKCNRDLVEYSDDAYAWLRGSVQFQKHSEECLSCMPDTPKASDQETEPSYEVVNVVPTRVDRIDVHTVIKTGADQVQHLTATIPYIVIPDPDYAYEFEILLQKDISPPDIHCELFDMAKQTTFMRSDDYDADSAETQEENFDAACEDRIYELIYSEERKIEHYVTSALNKIGFGTSDKPISIRIDSNGISVTQAE